MNQQDHRHLAIWLWTHSQSLTDNSETSVESGFSESSEFGRMSDSPLFNSTSHGTRMVACPPSTSFANMDLNHHVMNASSFLARLPMPTQPPPPYTPRAHPTHASLIKMHNTPVILSPVEVETDIDVVGLSDSTKDVSLNDEVNQDKPLDLSVKKQATISPVPRPSVIIEGCGNATSSNLRRSASSAGSNEPDVQEHFRRSLSGKWPKRNKSETEKGRASPFRRHTTHTFTSNLNPPAQNNLIITTMGTDIEDHFRRALGGEEFEAWKRRRQETTDKLKN